MNILLIDNGTKLLSKLEALVPGHEVVHTWRDFTDSDVESADLIVLSGGSVMRLKGNEEEFARELTLVRTTLKPVIGICFGTEVITVSFGGTLKELSVSHDGVKEVKLLDPSLLSGKETVQVYEHHRWIADVLPEEFEVLAESKDGPEMIRHKTRPIYGLQFHPEKLVEETDGKDLFFEVLRRLG